jgi:hypothetical protein
VKALASRALVVGVVHLVLTIINPGGHHSHLLISFSVFVAATLLGTGNEATERPR